MKVPLNWLRDYVSIPGSVAELVERLTLAGLEVASVRVLGSPVPDGVAVKDEDRGPVWETDKVKVARVRKVEKHPNADKLKLVTLDHGTGEDKVVVTGAPNIALGETGTRVIVGLCGTRYFDGHTTPKSIKELKPSTLRGVPSDAMVMSDFELGISDEHDGIIVLDDDVPPGTPAVELLGDLVIEADVLPNMARCLSLLGVAREVAALTGQTVCPPEITTPRTGEPITGSVRVEIADATLCPRYRAMLIRGVTIGPAPGWMRRRLAYAGMRPISTVVDVTNYVMLEFGQPLHAFDFDVLVKRARGQAPVITIRPAKAGETLTTLDGKERKLSPENLVIADAAGPIALAGVMGGAETEVSERTTNVLLESANFDYVSIRRTARQFDLISEASARFSRGVHPEVVPLAAERAAQLLQLHAGGTIAPGFVEAYPAPIAPQVVELSLTEVERILGEAVPADEADRILSSLEFQVERAGTDRLRVTVPPFRLDIQEGPADLIEELARVRGYDNLPATLPADPLPEQVGNPDLAGEERTRDLLVDAGLQEVVTYALTTPAREAMLTGEATDYVRLLNPISAERDVMRRTVLAGVLEAAANNLKHADTVRLFEIGPVFLPRAGEKLPDEPRRVAIVLTGRRTVPAWDEPAGEKPPMLDFFDLKGIIETLLEDLHVATVAFRKASVPYLHPGKTAEVRIGDRSVGLLGELHPKVAAAFHLTDRIVLAAELDLDAILAAVPERYDCRPVSRFQAALRDVAVIVPDDVTADRVLAELRSAGGDLLREARLFDVYRGPSVPAGTKSLAYALAYQADDRTLNDKDVDKAHKAVEDRLKQTLQAQIRGKDVK